MLTFSKAKDNRKLSKGETGGFYSFSLPAGYTCPNAMACKAWFDRDKNKLIDGPKQEFRCYAASMEAAYSGLRAMLWRNYNALLEARSMLRMVELIHASLPRNIRKLRLHISGDYFRETYFRAWLRVLQDRADIQAYGYTKALPFWVKYRSCVPANLVLCASYGGRHDHLITEHGLKHVRTVYSRSEAEVLWGLPIDTDDSLAQARDVNFALLIHGMQPAGSRAAKALNQIRKERQ